MTDARTPRRPERDLLETVAGVLRTRGYRTYLDPDGTDYFDLVVRRDETVGVLEGKAGGASNVLAQALVRRPWADWVAVVVGSRRAAERLVARTEGHRAAFVGVWSCVAGEVRELREAQPIPSGPADPFEATRARLRSALDALDRGELPAGIPWSDVLGEVRRSSGGRRYREWRLDEVVGPDA